ncbi:hypothetical protein [Sphingomonas aracearum]
MQRWREIAERFDQLLAARARPTN